jgi:hypothetical protein
MITAEQILEKMRDGFSLWGDEKWAELTKGNENNEYVSVGVVSRLVEAGRIVGERKQLIGGSYIEYTLTDRKAGV